jgi:hypothetical protein
MKRIALVVPVLLLAAACGGSDDKDQTASGLSKAEYLTKAEAVCKKANADQEALTFPTTAAAFPTYVQDLLDLADKATKEIDALEPPAADKADLETKVINPLKGQIVLGKTYLERIKEAVAANDQQKLGQLVASPPTGSKADLDWMRSYGFKECVESADTAG